MDGTTLFRSALTGCIFGFLACIPVGPINCTIINDGAKRGFLWSFMVGLGAMVMDVVYCSMAFAGFSKLFQSELIRATMELVSFLLMIFLGVRYMMVKEVPITDVPVGEVEHRFHPHAAFWIGFVRVLGNPAILLFWITLTATFLSHEWITDTYQSKFLCGVGNFFGGMAWFTLLSLAVTKGHKRFSSKTLMRMSQLSGLSLLITGVIIGIRLIRMIAHH